MQNKGAEWSLRVEEADVQRCVQMERYSSELEELQGSLRAAQESAAQYNAREALFGLPLTDYSAVRQAADKVEPFHAFWTAASRCGHRPRTPRCRHCHTDVRARRQARTFRNRTAVSCRGSLLGREIRRHRESESAHKHQHRKHAALWL